MKKIKKKTGSVISTPIILYIIIPLVAIGLFCISYYICKKNSWFSNLWLNLGYGTIASVFVSLLIDIGNTRRNNKMLDSKYDLLTSECKNDCKFLSKVAYYDFKGLYKSDEKLPFEKCVDKVITPEYDHSLITEDEHNIKSADLFSVINRLQKSADRLIDMIPYCYDERTNSELMNNVQEISQVCRELDYCRTHLNRKKDRLLKTAEDLKTAIINTFPELKDEFEKPYIIYNSKDVK